MKQLPDMLVLPALVAASTEEEVASYLLRVEEAWGKLRAFKPAQQDTERALRAVTLRELTSTYALPHDVAAHISNTYVVEEEEEGQEDG